MGVGGNNHIKDDIFGSAAWIFIFKKKRQQEEPLHDGRLVFTLPSLSGQSHARLQTAGEGVFRDDANIEALEELLIW